MASSKTSVLELVHEVAELVLELFQELVLEIQMAGAKTSVLELVLELVQELQMAGTRTSVLEMVLELVQELVLEVQMASSRTEVLEPTICTSRINYICYILDACFDLLSRQLV